ncbi:hypothetical protein D0T49_03005 [Paludibacter sp. 221]|uniref:hypothetical protein n=1 Tax=Paludibacter sp. 221 TaxID=2302939 RepID=UPI0013D442CB|nr:hypothetical protein [Paludibacter sp. 221]NDV46008.1 hypothetical protein [Paludibacter sp. 221]
MKKIIISAILCLLLVVPTIAQDAEGKKDPTVNKRGIALLPQAGDFAIGVDATPFLNYLGNFLNFGGNEAPAFNGVNNTVYMKYFLEDNAAIRAKINLNFTQDKFKQTLQDDAALLADPTNVDATTVDTWIAKNNGIRLNLGYELRRGKGRVQGFYGAEVLLGYGRTKNEYVYGNAMTVDNQSPTSFDFTLTPPTPPTPPVTPSAMSKRTVNSKGGAEFTAGLGAFVGVEYFFAPQISIGGELGLGFNYLIKGQSEITTEQFLGDDILEKTKRKRSYEDDAFSTGFQTVPTGKIFLMFHF